MLIQVTGHGLSHALPGNVEPRHDRADGTVESFRDLAIREPLPRTEEERGAVLGGKPGDGPGHDRRELVPERDAGRIVVRAAGVQPVAPEGRQRSFGPAGAPPPAPEGSVVAISPREGGEVAEARRLPPPPLAE